MKHSAAPARARRYTSQALTPLGPRIPGQYHPAVLGCIDVLLHTKPPCQRVGIIGARGIGLVVADRLAQSADLGLACTSTDLLACQLDGT